MQISQTDLLIDLAIRFTHVICMNTSISARQHSRQLIIIDANLIYVPQID